MEEIREMIEYYRAQGAPQDQQMLIALLREAQEAAGGMLTPELLAEIAKAYGIRDNMLRAMIRYVPSLRLHTVPHRLEICGSCRAGAGLRNMIERTDGVKSGGSCEEAGFSYRVTPCMKNCKNGPSVRFDGVLYAHADEALLRGLIEGKSNPTA